MAFLLHDAARRQLDVQASTNERDLRGQISLPLGTRLRREQVLQSANASRLHQRVLHIVGADRGRHDVHTLHPACLRIVQNHTVSCCRKRVARKNFTRMISHF